ncbi:MAG TPA: sigma-70 family RNA polymerase sigma factor, partial [Candidatus Dormibacteraeota bacterium]|nr:sigma-70 family RNA polymerase sigma factor [Candidatus Dormibacteraeota bacterium]
LGGGSQKEGRARQGSGFFWAGRRVDRNDSIPWRIHINGVTALEAVIGTNGDRDLAERLTPLIPGAQRLAYGMLQNPHDAEDAVQEATFKAWRAFSRFREGGDVRAWFLTIVANECRQRRRSRWWSVLKLGDHPPQLQQPRDDVDAIDLRYALNRLPEQMKLVLVLRYYLDLSLDDVGEVLGVSPKAAKARIHRALTRLRVDIPELLTDE